MDNRAVVRLAFPTMSLSTEEFYIRKAEETDARGPFSLEQLASLAENGQANPDTLYYDASTECWLAINANTALLDALFPAKKSLRVKAKDVSQLKTLNVVNEGDRAITVNEMLLAAEGRTEETRDRADPAIAQAKAAGIGLYAAMATLFITAAAYILPHIDVVMSADVLAILQVPVAVLGLFNLGLGVCLALSAVGVYPTVRFAAMLGFGFLGSLFALENQFLPLAFSAATAVGLYFSTILINMPGVLTAATLGILGACGLAQFFFTT